MSRSTFRMFAILACMLFGFITGEHAVAQQKAVGPVLKIIPDLVSFDSVYCRVRVCKPITFKNIGDTALIVHNIDKIIRPFYSRIDTPFTLQPGEMKTFDYCYTPLTWSRDSQKVALRVDSRVPISIGMLFDVSFSMYTVMPDGKQRISGTNAAGREFVKYLLDTLDIEDEAAVYTFDIDENFKKVQSFTKDTALLRAAIPAVVTGTATCTYDAISRVIDSLRYRSKARFIVVLTDGDDSGKPTCGPDGVDSVLRKAAETNTRIYTITIGNVDQSDLAMIAQSSGGKYFNAGNTLDLLSVYRQIATELSKNNVMDFRTKGWSLGPRIEIDPKNLQFDSVQVGQTKCLPITIRNGGNAPLPADSVRKLFNPPYVLHDLIPDVILPFQTLPATLCFSPTLPRDFTQAISFLASPCEVFYDTIRAGATSYLLPRVTPKRAVVEYDVPTFDTTLCGTTECLEVVFRNTGDTVLNVLSVDPVPAPFSGSIPAPFTIDPDGERRFNICYHPEEAPRDDTLRLGFEAELRPPQTIGLLFDEGEEMGEEFLPGVTRLTSAVAGASDFIDGLLFNEAIPDRAGILRFSSAKAMIGNGLLSDRAALQALLNDTVRNRPSCIYDAVQQAVDSIATAAGPKKIILFTSGSEAASGCGGADAQSAGLRAAAAGVQVIALQFGNADSSGLATMVTLSGGEYHRPADLFDLILTLRDIDARMTGRVRNEMLAFAHAVTPIIATTVTEIDFGAADTATEVTRCFTIYNTGTAPLRVPSIDKPIPPFHYDSIVNPGFGNHWLWSGQQMVVDTMIIMPGDSTIWCVTFRPFAGGRFADTLTLSHNGCLQPDLRIVLHGMGIARPAADWKYPTALSIPPDAEYLVPCGPVQCSPLTFRNPGSVTNRIRFIRTPAPPWSIRPSDSLSVSAGGSAETLLCFDPASGGESRDSIIVESLVRPQLGIVVLLARDASMNAVLPEGFTADGAALAAVRILRDNMRADTTDGDVLQVYSMEDAGPDFGIEYVEGGSREGNWPPRAAAGNPVELRDALRQAVDIAAALEGSRHVILLASDISTGSGFDAGALSAYASANGVHLHHQLFAPRNSDSLRTHAGTLWTYGEYSTLTNLSGFLHAATLTEPDVKLDTIRVHGTVRSPMLEVLPVSLSFGTVTVGSDRCLPVRLRNTGTASLRVSAIINPADPLPVELPADILPGSETIINLCFKATAFGEASATARIIYDACPLDTILIPMTAFGSDSLTVGINGVFVGKPGSITHIPVQLFGQLPPEYDVRTVEIELQCNKTMLYPLDPKDSQESTLMGGLQIETLGMTPSFTATDVRTRYRITRKSPLNNLTPGSVMLRLPFLVLLGDALSTPVRITDIRFNDGLPRAGVAVNGEFRVDSLCYIEQRLLDSGKRSPAKITGVSPNPFNESTTITVEVLLAGQLRMTIHNIMGDLVEEVLNGPMQEGRHSVVINGQSWPSGVYLCRLELDGFVLHERIIRTK